MQGGGFFYPSLVEQRRSEKEIGVSGGFYIHSPLYKESKTSETT
jgi:hypothetical protein